MYNLKQLYPKRNYNRAISLPERYSKEKFNLLPEATKKLVRYIMDLTEEGTKQTETTIRKEQENVDGLLDIQEQKKKKNLKRLTDALSEYGDMKKLDEKISEIWKLPEFSTISQQYDDYAD
jgi:hypothetical protein